MRDMSRRDLLKVTAVAVPMAAIGTNIAGTGAASRLHSDVGTDTVGYAGRQPVMFYVHDARRGEVSILHGTTEVVVRDRQLVAKIMRAAGSPTA